jgi:hypothetical protein
MKIRDLDRIRFVTRHFNDLQGLRLWVPLGLFTLALASPLLLGLVLVLAACLLSLGARRYYQGAFGAVELSPALEADPLSVFSPAGPAARLGETPGNALFQRRFLTTTALALVLFSIVQAMPPAFQVEGIGPGRPPRVKPLPHGILERPWIIGDQPQPRGIFQPPWVEWVYSKTPVRPVSMLRAIFAQTVYLVFGCFFLCLWIWRERRRAQAPLAATAGLLLTLSAAGASIGFLAGRDGSLPPWLEPLLPALVYPGAALLVCGGVMVLAGLFDHWQLKRALGAPAEAA